MIIRVRVKVRIRVRLRVKVVTKLEYFIERFGPGRFFCLKITFF